ncbi:HalOD1 output domain-containing protein [Haladaptatus salinisoli]|uniref:HalOD1 output domain-containing protein n=1 Tax=Haladaptatus salinisoli TaxID=2884876 RepID=UPI001D0A841C|nr:HalOD1 output domain-containing protein [Haladaptatus salinisoli]
MTTDDEEPFTTDFEDGRRPSEAVVEAVAAVEGVPALQLDPPLYHVLDPEALDSLLTGGSRPERIAFSYHGYDVDVRRDGHITVE